MLFMMQRFVIHPNSGEHGYDNALENMRTSYFSIGPSFKVQTSISPDMYKQHQMFN